MALIVFELLNLFGMLDFTLDFSWLGLIVTSAVSLIILEAIYRGFRKNGAALPAFPYVLAAGGLWFDALGDIAHLYGKYAWYDQAAHILGGAILMSISIAILSRVRERNGTSIALMLAICLAFTALFGNFYEFEEYLEDALYHKRQVRLGDGPDTVNDLMLNLFGGASAGAIYFLIRRNKKD
jgi:hypothetical protein